MEFSSGKLFYVVGPAGAGKEALIRFARERVPLNLPLVFAHRYIVRPVVQLHGADVCLSEREFDFRRRHGLFAMHWAAHGSCYAVGIEMHQWLARGVSVVVTGSREYLIDAFERYPELVLICVIAPLSVLEARLAGSSKTLDRIGRERFARAPLFPIPIARAALVIHNASDADSAGPKLLEFLIESVSAHEPQLAP